MRSLLWLIVAVLLSACASKQLPPQTQIVRVVEKVEIKTPVYVKAMPPPELLVTMSAKIIETLPVFIDPRSAAASSALSLEGEAELRHYVEQLLKKLDEGLLLLWALQQFYLATPEGDIK